LRSPYLSNPRPLPRGWREHPSEDDDTCAMNDPGKWDKSIFGQRHAASRMMSTNLALVVLVERAVRASSTSYGTPQG
jgi:hypothetical protein